MDWEDVYLDVMLQGFSMHDMPSSNDVWGTYLHEHGFKRYVIPDTCPECYTVERFVQDNPDLTGILATGTHVIAVSGGLYSGREERRDQQGFDRSARKDPDRKR